MRDTFQGIDHVDDTLNHEHVTELVFTLHKMGLNIFPLLTKFQGSSSHSDSTDLTGLKMRRIFLGLLGEPERRNGGEPGRVKPSRCVHSDEKGPVLPMFEIGRAQNAWQ